MSRYTDRLSHCNRCYIAQLLRLCGAFIEHLSPKMTSNPSHVGSSTTASPVSTVSAMIQPGKTINTVKSVISSGVVKTVGAGKSSAGIYTVNNFIFTWRIDTVNLCQLVAYVTQSGIARKVMGFVEKQAAVATASCMGLYFVWEWP